MKRLMTLILAVLVMVPVSACGLQPDGTGNADLWPERVTIATSTSGGTAYYIGAAQTQILNSAIKGVSFVAETTDGTPATNGSIVQNDATCLSINAIVGTQDAITGNYEDLPGVALDKLRLVMVGHTTTLQFVTLKESGITSLDQLKGKKVSTSNPGTVTRMGTLQVLDKMGYKEDDFASLTAMTSADMADALKDGALDVGVFNGGTYIASLADLNSTRDVVMLQAPEDILDELIKEHPGYTTEVVTPDVYSDLTQDYTILGMPMALWCNADMDEDLVYEITKVLNESVDEMAAAHTNGADWNTENTLAFYNGGTVPFHPGAARYYDEIQGK